MLDVELRGRESDSLSQRFTREEADDHLSWLDNRTSGKHLVIPLTKMHAKPLAVLCEA